MIKLVLDTFIPGDADLGMPSASQIDFEAYQLKYQTHKLVDEFLAELTLLSQSKYGNNFVELDEEKRLAAVNSCKAKNIRLFVAFLTNCFRAYYSDKIVLSCLAVGAVPPYPIGNMLKPDDWSQLEPVYERGPIYRVVHET